MNSIFEDFEKLDSRERQILAFLLDAGVYAVWFMPQSRSTWNRAEMIDFSDEIFDLSAFLTLVA